MGYQYTQKDIFFNEKKKKCVYAQDIHTDKKYGRTFAKLLTVVMSEKRE